MSSNNFKLEFLGQSGFLFKSEFLNFMIDPYLSNSVQELDSHDLKREIPIPYYPNQINFLDWIFITHTHIDHCDPHTLPVLAEHNPKAKFMGPKKVRKRLVEWGISSKRIYKANSEKFEISKNVFINALPAAHPKLTYDSEGEPNEIGWIFEINNKKIFFAGDTSLTEEILNYLKKFIPIQCGFLPVNEDNFFRRRRGIIGNMSIREAFGLADELDIKKVYPVHWDLFNANSTLLEEIKVVHEGYPWRFDLIFSTENIL